MIFTLLGTRGSRPVFTPERVQYGGNTTSYKIQIDGMSPIYVDFGTGVYREGLNILENNGDKPFKAHFLITHTHWDHILAFPFFTPIYRDSTSVTIHGPRSEKYSIKNLFQVMHDKGLFPVPFSILGQQVTFKELRPNERFQLEDATIKTYQLNHQGLTIGYRIEHEGKTIAIITDNAPIQNNHLGYEIKDWPPEQTDQKEKEFEDGLVEFIRDADLMVFDTHFKMDTIKGKENWGHSTPEMSIDFGVRGNVKRILLAHHAPEDSDADIESKLTQAKTYLSGISDLNIDILALSEGDQVCL